MLVYMSETETVVVVGDEVVLDVTHEPDVVEVVGDEDVELVEDDGGELTPDNIDAVLHSLRCRNRGFGC
jgi:hypothetical protein